MSDWRLINDGHAPIGEPVMVGNVHTGDVFPAYAYWGKAPFPLWCSLHPDGMGRCRPTHYQPKPTISMGAVGLTETVEAAA